MTEKPKGMGLKLYLVEHGLTVAETARRAHMSSVWLSALLNGRAELTERRARDLAVALRIPKERIWQLWRGEQS